VRRAPFERVGDDRLARDVPRRGGGAYGAHQEQGEEVDVSRVLAPAAAPSSRRRPHRCRSVEFAQRRPFMHGEMIRLIALDQVLRRLPRRAHRIGLERDGFRDLPPNYSPYSTCLGVPAHMVANLEFDRRNLPSSSRRGPRERHPRQATRNGASFASIAFKALSYEAANFPMPSSSSSREI